MASAEPSDFFRKFGLSSKTCHLGVKKNFGNASILVKLRSRLKFSHIGVYSRVKGKGFFLEMFSHRLRRIALSHLASCQSRLLKAIGLQDVKTVVRQ